VGLLEGLLELLCPTRCAGCDMPGQVLCGSCHAALPQIERASACVRCGAPFGHLVCTECGRVAHSTCELGETTAAAATAAGFSITGHDLTLWGVCAECAATTPWTANREDVRER